MIKKILLLMTNLHLQNSAILSNEHLSQAMDFIGILFALKLA